MNIKTATRPELIAYIAAHHVDSLDIDDASENAPSDYSNDAISDLRIFAGFAAGIAARAKAHNAAYLTKVAADERAEEYRIAALGAPRRAARAIKDGTAAACNRILRTQERDFGMGIC